MFYELESRPIQNPIQDSDWCYLSKELIASFKLPLSILNINARVPLPLLMAVSNISIPDV